MSIDSALTLAKLNENAYEWNWSDTYRRREVFAVGQNGSSYRGATGSKTHILRASVVIEDFRPEDKRRADTYKVGDTMSVQGLCNSNGQHTGRVNAKLDLSDVTCEKCLKRLAAMRSK